MNKPTPSKSQEIEILTAAADQLGGNSYLGPWLKQILPELESAILSDLLPQISLTEAKQQATAIVAAAHAEAAAVKSEAEKISAAQYKRLEQARANLSAALFDVSRRAERFAHDVSVA